MEQLNITATKDNDKVYKILDDLMNRDKLPVDDDLTSPLLCV